MYEEIVQGSMEWHSARLGKATGSRMADILAKGRNGVPSQSRSNYMAELVAERITGQPTERFKSAAMAWGTELEPTARAWYEAFSGEIVTEVGFIPHPTIPMAGSSPDGLIGKDGALEIKAPQTVTHLGYIKDWKVPEKYVPQCQWALACTNRAWLDFVSFDPRIPSDLCAMVIRMERDDEYIAMMEKEVADFLKEVDQAVILLQQRSTK